ncbi:hypothetical protein ABZ478_37960 [Streptomyces sp. NPDC005706]|uniref:hypothetical protein n=1 Tax=Streptomyces sp. NPDC005706 TaxID=3157169 RepID=UPI0033F6953C
MGAFVALVDEGFDRPGRPASSAEARGAPNPLLAVLKGTSTYTDTLPSAAGALRDLWRRTCVRVASAWRAYFTAAYAAFAERTYQAGPLELQSLGA